jgi:hypothetical protein
MRAVKFSASGKVTAASGGSVVQTSSAVQQEASSAPAASGPCDDYRLDMMAASFGSC